MHHREKQLGYRTVAKPEVLILPFVIDNSDCFPPEVQDMQGENIYKFANPYIRPDSPRQEEFAEHLRTKFCPRVERTLQSVPPFDPAWETLAHDQFNEMFRIKVAAQKTLPTLSLLPISSTSSSP